MYNFRCHLGLADYFDRPSILLQQEAVANLRKNRSLYIQRQQEYEKARTQKAEVETQAPGSGTSSAKAEKKKKLEEDAMLRVRQIQRIVMI